MRLRATSYSILRSLENPAADSGSLYYTLAFYLDEEDHSGQWN